MKLRTVLKNYVGFKYLLLFFCFFNSALGLNGLSHTSLFIPGFNKSSDPVAGRM